MIGAWRKAEAILRGQPEAGSCWLVLGCGLAYGSVMGSFGGRIEQVAFSAIKVPLLLLATLMLSLPSYFVLNTMFPRGGLLSHAALAFVYHRKVTQLARNLEDRTGGAAPWTTSLASAA